jgi:hypothetical protein
LNQAELRELDDLANIVIGNLPAQVQHAGHSRQIRGPLLRRQRRRAVHHPTQLIV